MRNGPAHGAQCVFDSAGHMGVDIVRQHDNPLRPFWDTSSYWLYRSLGWFHSSAVLMVMGMSWSRINLVVPFGQVMRLECLHFNPLAAKPHHRTT
jgi:hypothetical protein